MTALVRFILVVIGISFGLALFTEYMPGTLDARTHVLGLPVISIAQVGAQGWIGIGQAATGVLVIAQAGGGVVALTQVGAGVFFGVGQLVASLAAIGQIGIGVFVFLGQLGFGAQALGQGVFKSRPKGWFTDLNAELGEVLSFKSPSPS